jgi:hypothetical protein
MLFDFAAQLYLSPLRDYFDQLAKATAGPGSVPLMSALDAINRELGPGSPAAKLIARLYDAFTPALMRWVQGHHERYHDVLSNTIKMEKWEPYSKGARFSHSVVDVFSVFDQTMPVIIDLEIPKLAELIGAEAQSADAVLRQYANILAEGCVDYAALRPPLPPPVADQPVWKAKINLYRRNRRGKTEAGAAGSASSGAGAGAGAGAGGGGGSSAASGPVPASSSSSVSFASAVGPSGDASSGDSASSSSDDDLMLRRRLDTEDGDTLFSDPGDDNASAANNSSAADGGATAASGKAGAVPKSPAGKVSWKEKLKDKKAQFLEKRRQEKDAKEREKLEKKEQSRREAKEIAKGALAGDEENVTLKTSVKPLRELLVRLCDLEEAHLRLNHLRRSLEARCEDRRDDAGNIIGGKPFAIFDVTRRVIDESSKAMVRFLGYKVVYVDLELELLEDLYVPDVRSARLQTVIPLLDNALGDLVACVDEPLRSQLLLSLLTAMTEMLLRVLLDGGSQRTIMDTDATMLGEDIHQLEELFIARDEATGAPRGLSEEAVKKETRYLRVLVSDAMELSTDSLIAAYDSLEDSSALNPRAKNVFYRVLLHRAQLDPAAAKFTRQRKAPEAPVRKS